MSSEKGLSLLGVLIAIFILTTAALVVSQLAARTEHTVGTAQQEFIAALLAREGLELVQAVRDTNWLEHDAAETGECATNRMPDQRDECWAERLCGEDGQDESSGHTIAIDRDPSAGIIVEHGPSDNRQKLYRDDDGLWSHAISASETPYRRRLTLDCSQRAATLPRLPVTATVEWINDGATRTVTVSGEVYNWYKEL